MAEAFPIEGLSLRAGVIERHYLGKNLDEPPRGVLLLPNENTTFAYHHNLMGLELIPITAISSIRIKVF